LGAAAYINSAAASEKDAMLMTDKMGPDALVSAYVTDLDHLKDSIAGLKELSKVPSEIAALEEIEGAVRAYFAAGEQMYAFMVDQEPDKAHALSLGAAHAAGERIIALVRKPGTRPPLRCSRPKAWAARSIDARSGCSACR
jgi:hypothetical protein